MKLVVKWCIFLYLMNIFIPMIAVTGFFPTVYEGDTTYFDLNDPDDLPTEQEAFEDATAYEFDSLSDIGYETFGILGLSTLIGIGLMKVTRSLSPLLISLFFATFFNIWRRSAGIFNNLEVNKYIIIGIGSVALIYWIYTLIEYYHQGDASDS